MNLIRGPDAAAAAPVESHENTASPTWIFFRTMSFWVSVPAAHTRDYIISAGVWCVIESMVTCFIGKEVGNAAQFFGNR